MFRAVILGAPASGKGTISSRIVKYFGLTHISSGDLLRLQIQKQSELGAKASKFVTDGNLVPDDLMLELVLSELKALGSQNWLLDGFPRTRSQGEMLLDLYKINVAIALDVPVEEMVNRLKGRWVHVASGRVYNETYNRPHTKGKDDITGENLEQRPDDAPASVRQRLRVYAETAQPLLNLYEEHGILRKFSGRTSDEIWPKVQECLYHFIKTETS